MRIKKKELELEKAISKPSGSTGSESPMLRLLKTMSETATGPSSELAEKFLAQEGKETGISGATGVTSVRIVTQEMQVTGVALEKLERMTSEIAAAISKSIGGIDESNVEIISIRSVNARARRRLLNSVVVVTYRVKIPFDIDSASLSRKLSAKRLQINLRKETKINGLAVKAKSPAIQVSLASTGSATSGTGSTGASGLDGTGPTGLVEADPKVLAVKAKVSEGKRKLEELDNKLSADLSSEDREKLERERCLESINCRGRDRS